MAAELKRDNEVMRQQLNLTKKNLQSTNKTIDGKKELITSSKIQLGLVVCGYCWIAQPGVQYILLDCDRKSNFKLHSLKDLKHSQVI